MSAGDFVNCDHFDTCVCIYHCGKFAWHEEELWIQTIEENAFNVLVISVNNVASVTTNELNEMLHEERLALRRFCAESSDENAEIMQQ